MNKKQKKMLRRIIGAAAVYVLLLVFMHVYPGFDGLPFIVKTGMFMVPYLIIGYDILLKAFKGIKNLQAFDENLLMSIATLAAFAIGEYTESVAVMLFYQVGELFQSYAVNKSRNSITDLMSIVPEYANLMVDGEVEQVDPDEVSVGDIIVIRPGEKIPLDGVVTYGSSFLDTSPLTGESVPRRVSENDSVISGCINGEGTLRVKVSKAFEDSTVSRILELVEESGEKKARLENFITRFARWYTPIVTISALILAVVPPLVLGQDFGGWVHRACTFLIVSCPCALVISVPLGFFAGIGAASRDGILVKGGNFLEAAAGIENMVFDKTGTITRGEFKVKKVHVSPELGMTEKELLLLAASVEKYSTHPIAGAIVNACAGEDLKAEVSGLKEISGKGISAEVSIKGEGYRILAGNAALLRDAGVEFEDCEDGGTLVYVSFSGKYAGAIVIDDAIKENAPSAIAELRNAGVRHCVLLSGDRNEAARRISDEAGLDSYVAELRPEDKVSAFERIMAEADRKGVTAYVGDGINDAPVLMRSDIGFAMGAAGSDAAIEAADIVLIDDDLSKLPRLIALAKQVRRIVRENIVFAIGVKLLVLLFGALGIATLWAAVFADVGVAVIAILNSMRLLKA